jgi:hypothetical protein
VAVTEMAFKVVVVTVSAGGVDCALTEDVMPSTAITVMARAPDGRMRFVMVHTIAVVDPPFHCDLYSAL